MPKAFPSERRRDVVAVAGKTEAPTAHIAKDLVQCRFRMKASLAGAALRNAAPAPLSRQDGGALGPRRFRFGSSSKRCAATDLVDSTGRAGWGNAAAESFLAALKNDMYPRAAVPDPGAGPIRRRRPHRGVLRPAVPAPDARLPHPRRGPVPATDGRLAASINPEHLSKILGTPHAGVRTAWAASGRAGGR